MESGDSNLELSFLNEKDLFLLFGDLYQDTMNNLHYRLNFGPSKMNKIFHNSSEKHLGPEVLLTKEIGQYNLAKFANFYVIFPKKMMYVF